MRSDLKPRTIYSQSKLVTEQMSSGKKWATIKRAITIVITDEIFIPESEKYHHQFRYRTGDGIEFSNLVEINTLDLSKLPPDDDSTELWYWMKFIKSDDEEVLDVLAERSPQIKKAVGVLKELSADERARMIYESRQMAEWDFDSRVSEAEEKGKAEGKLEKAIEIARKLLKLEIPIEKIIETTGLTHDEVKELINE